MATTHELILNSGQRNFFKPIQKLPVDIRRFLQHDVVYYGGGVEQLAQEMYEIFKSDPRYRIQVETIEDNYSMQRLVQEYKVLAQRIEEKHSKTFFSLSAPVQSSEYGTLYTNLSWDFKGLATVFYSDFKVPSLYLDWANLPSPWTEYGAAGPKGVLNMLFRGTFQKLENYLESENISFDYGAERPDPPMFYYLQGSQLEEIKQNYFPDWVDLEELGLV